MVAPPIKVSMVVDIDITLRGARGVGKTFIAERLLATIEQVMLEVPMRAIRVTIHEKGLTDE